MDGVAPISRSSVVALSKPGRVDLGEDYTPAPGRASDRVELSDQARRMSTALQVPAVRWEVIQRVRAEIRADRYLTPEKVDTAIERVLSSLTAESP